MTFEPIDVDGALELLRRTLCSRAEFAHEYAASREEFFVGPAAAVSPADALRADRRHAEWFLLERPSAALGGAPIEWALHNAGQPGAPELADESLRALLESRCSVFEVTSVTPGEGAWARDLAAGGEYPLYEPAASRALESGDVIAGRLFAVGGGLHALSPAAGVFRSAELLEALSSDVENLRKSRRGVLRLSQRELESMFFGGPAGAAAGASSQESTARARRFLLDSGLGAEQVERLLDELGATPFRPAAWAHGARDGLGALLERLAFETEVDLDGARRVLLEAWPELAAQRAPKSTRGPSRANPNASGDVRAAIEAFDRGRDAGRDLEELFRDLERDLELEPESYDPDAVDGAPAPDFPGVVSAMVEEFLWDMAREHGEEQAKRWSAARKFAQFGQHVGVFENLGARDLLLFTAVWLPERGELRSSQEAREVLEALSAFCAWTQETQEVMLADAYRENISELEAALPRIVAANQRRGAIDERDAARGELCEFLGDDGGLARLRDRSGEERSVSIDAKLLGELEPGDRVRALIAGGEAQILCCYPPQVVRLAP